MHMYCFQFNIVKRQGDENAIFNAITEFGEIAR